MLIKVTSDTPIEVITVKQERGQDSTIQVFQEVYTDWPRDRKALRFVSDQSLASQSDRSYNVEKAIKEYAHPKGFDTSRYTQKNKNEWIVFYDENFHSHMNEFSIRIQIQNDPRYQSKKEENTQVATGINREFGIAIRQLKNLITALENKNNQELDRLNQELIAIQVEILKGLDIPEILNEQHKKYLFEPNYPIDQVKMDNYATYGQGYDTLPTDLNSILALLD